MGLEARSEIQDQRAPPANATALPALLGNLVESLCGQSSILDRDGRIVLVNQDWRDFAARNDYPDGGHGLGADYLDVCATAEGEGAEDARALLEGLRQIYGKERDVFIHAYPCHSPVKNRWFQCQARRLLLGAGEEDFVVLVQHVDISDKVEQLNDRTRALEMANDAMQQFVYVVSHDLREPLRAIVGFSNLTMARFAELLPAKGREYLTHIEQGGGRMSSLLDGLMGYVRATEVQEAPRPFDLNHLFANVCEELSGAIIKSGAEVTAEPLPEVVGHPELIRQVLKNLIENALKYRSDQPPRIRVSALEEPGAWTISVQDNGIGIEPGHAKNIFRIFQRLHRRDDIPGIGIGLAICRKIVEIHGGRIWLDGAVKSGTRFCFSLPRKPGP